MKSPRRKGGDQRYSHWWDFSSAGRLIWFLVAVFALGVLTFALLGPRQSLDPDLNGNDPDRTQVQPRTYVEEIVIDALAKDVEIGLADLAEAQVRRVFSELRGPALDSYIAIITAPSFRLLNCLIPDSASNMQYELKRRLAALPKLLSGPLIRDQAAADTDLAEVSLAAAAPSAIQLIDRQLQAACSWPNWLKLAQASVVLVAIYLAIYHVRGGMVGRLSFVALTALIAALCGSYVFLVSYSWGPHANMRAEIRDALDQDEQVIIEDIRAKLQGLPFIGGGGTTGTPSQRFE